MRTPRTQRNLVAVLVVGAGILVLFALYNATFQSHKSNESNRVAMREIYETVHLGASWSDVSQAYYRHRTDSLRLYSDHSSEWTVRMPMEFGASDWKLLIEFRDGRVVAVRLRTSDGPQPTAGPKDKEGNTG